MISPINTISFKSNYDLNPQQKKQRSELTDKIYDQHKDEFENCCNNSKLRCAQGGCIGGMVISCLAFGAIMGGIVSQCSSSLHKELKKEISVDSLKPLAKDTLEIFHK